MRALRRLGLWGVSAAGAVALVVLAAQTETGGRRVLMAWASLTSAAASSEDVASPARPDDPERQTRRLAEQIRILSSDRERLAARLAALEQGLEDVTGSISRQVQREADLPPGDAPSATRAPVTQRQGSPHSGTPAALGHAAELGWAASVSQPGALPHHADWPASAPAAAAPPNGKTHAAATADGAPAAATVLRTEFGVDVGGGTTISALRALWLSIRSSHPSLLEGLRPVLTIREGPRGTTELRLLAGPLPNAGTAARLCGSLAAAGLTCQPAVFDGQRLALR